MNDEIIKNFGESFERDDTYEIISKSENLVGELIDSLLPISVFTTINNAIEIYDRHKLNRLRERLFKFLFNVSMSNTTKEEREKFIEELTDANKEDAYEVLFDMIDRLNNINKVDVLANLMIARIKGKITIVNFVRLCDALERIPYPDLCALKNYDKGDCDDFSAASLLGAGMLSDAPVWYEVGKEDAENMSPYHITTLGEKMIEYGLPESM